MNFEELDFYLRSFSTTELKDLEKIKKHYHYQNNQEVFDNFKNIQKDYKQNMFKFSGDPMYNNFSFKKHGRFNLLESHRHNYVEMSYVYSGRITQFINGQELQLTKGDLVILDTNVKHTFQMAGKDDILLNFLLATEFFNNTFFKNSQSDNIISYFVIHTLYESHKYNDYLYFKTNNHPYFHQLICMLSIEFIAPDIFMENNTNHYLMILFNELVRIYDTQDKSQEEIARTKKTYQFLQIKSYIEENYFTTNLDIAAKHFNFHPNYFSKYVKEVTGLNFKNLILNERLNKANYLLLQTDMTIEAISYECGFTNMNTFYNSFKHQYGTTPKKYRTSKKKSNHS